MKQTEKLIVEQLKQGNESAYKYIYEHHYVVLCHVANQYIRDPFLAETVVGDVIFHLWEIREKLQINISIRSYLMRAVRNRCIDRLRSEREQREISFSSLQPDSRPDEHPMPSDEHPLGILLHRELEEEIHRAISRLPSECRRVFGKSRFEKKTHKEIAEELGISVNTVKYHIKNALLQLNEELGSYLLALSLLLSWLNGN